MAEFNSNYYCPITQELFVDPVIDSDGNTFERAAIMEWINVRGTSPITRNSLRVEDLVPNRVLAAAIESERSSLPARHPENTPLNVNDIEPHLRLPELGVEIVSLPVKDIDPSDTSNDQYVLTNVVPPANCARIASDIVVCIDTSGSMGMEATAAGVENSGLSMLDVVKHAVKTIVEVLEPDDRLAIVKYSNAADVVKPLTIMNAEGKTALTTAVNRLSEGGMTNLWDGLKNSLELLAGRTEDNVSGIPGNARNASVFLLTDGVPNVEPPRGYLPTLKRFKDQHGGKYPGIINTFGFGYNLESGLLYDLANEGKGAYAFIPDSGFVGTVFVNALANTLSTFVEESIVGIAAEPTGAVVKTLSNGDVALENESDGISFSGKIVNIGQPYGYITRINSDVTTNVVFSTLKYKHVGVPLATELTNITLSGPQAPTESASARQEVAAEVFRYMAIQAIDGALEKLSGNNEQDPANYDLAVARIKNTAEVITAWLSTHADAPTIAIPGATRPSVSAYTKISALLEDLSGQMTEAVSRKDYYTKWGKHYLRSIRRAHELKQCNNFKDPGVQHYGNSTFESIRDLADDKFSNLPPPVAHNSRPSSSNISRSSSSSMGGGGGASRSAPPPPTMSMSSFNNRDMVCFHGNASVHLKDSAMKTASQVVPGDVLSTGGVVACIVKTNTGDTCDLVRMPDSGLLLTPWHPVLYEGRWIHPVDIGQIERVPCEAVYSFLARNNEGSFTSTVVVDGVIAATLAHGVVDTPKLSHPFFGTGAIVDALAQCAGWDEGVVEFHACDQGAASFMLRDAVTGLVEGFKV